MIDDRKIIRTVTQSTILTELYIYTFGIQTLLPQKREHVMDDNDN